MMLYLVLICFEMVTSYQIYSNPPDTLHFCFENTRLVLKGKDNYLYKIGDGKSAYSRPIHQETCHHIKNYLNSINTKQCSPQQVLDTNYLYPIYQKTGCFLAIDNFTDFSDYQEKIKNYLTQQCGECLKNSIIYTDIESKLESVYPPDTNHYCSDNTVILVQGYDNVGFSSHSQSSKSQVGVIETYDSCYHIRQYFKTRYSKCHNYNTTRETKKILFPIRHFGNCFVSAHHPNTTQLTYDLMQYLKHEACQGCLGGDYFVIDVSSGIRCKNQIIYLVICLVIVIVKGF